MAPDFNRELARLSGFIESKRFELENILRAEAGTTGFAGGDWGHGGRSYVKLEDEASTGWMIRVVDSGGREHVFDQPRSVELLFGGDAELRNLARALVFIVETLFRQEPGLYNLLK